MLHIKVTGLLVKLQSLTLYVHQGVSLNYTLKVFDLYLHVIIICDTCFANCKYTLLSSWPECVSHHSNHTITSSGDEHWRSTDQPL